jgi:hypothetical protein
LPVPFSGEWLLPATNPGMQELKVPGLAGWAHSSPRSLPVKLLMKCSLWQAAQTTDLWVPLGSSSDATGSQCCTFIPVCGHL